MQLHRRTDPIEHRDTTTCALLVLFPVQFQMQAQMLLLDPDGDGMEIQVATERRMKDSV